MELTENILAYIEQHRQEAYDLLIELAKIPAPSGKEEKRVAFIKNWLEKQGAKGVYVDEALNVIYPVGCTEDNPLMVFAAHTDLVFPDTEELPMTIQDGEIHCPGVGDDTANLVALLMVAKYIAENNLSPKDHGLLIVADSCEEGLGDLKGSRQLMKVFGSRVTQFVSFDCMGPGYIYAGAVGSKRYRIEIDTEGGHSFGAFGNRNAIAYMAALINDLYNIKVPPKGKTTYNVGIISGGTSVNTIAQHAEMLYEFRSDEGESLAVMQKHMDAALEFYRTKGVQVTCTLVGDRPCSNAVDPEKHQKLLDRLTEVAGKHYGVTPKPVKGSTDCNIPLSMGIPSGCVGCLIGKGAHTREEFIYIDSLLPGLRLAFDLVLGYI